MRASLNGMLPKISCKCVKNRQLSAKHTYMNILISFAEQLYLDILLGRISSSFHHYSLDRFVALNLAQMYTENSSR